MKHWNQALSALISAALIVGTAGAMEKLDYACYGTADALLCSQHSLHCLEGTIFVTSVLRLFWETEYSCEAQTTSCNEDHVTSCCRDTSYRCWENFSDAALTDLVDQCWNKRNCTYTVQKAMKQACPNYYKDESGYSRLRYICLPARTALDFSDNRTVTASSIELRYSSSHNKGDYVCLVEADDCTNQTVTVILLRTETSSSVGECTTLAISEGTWLSCNSASWQNTSSTADTPFRVRLSANGDNDANLAWIVIYGSTESTLRVTCKPWRDRNSFPECTHGTSNTAGIVGGVVGVLLLVLLVVLVVTLVFLKRRSPTTNPIAKAVAWFKGSNSCRSDGNSGRAESHVTYAQPTSLPVYDNSAVTITDEAGVRDPDGDYNHLGQKPTSSASPDVTYGHLTDGNDVTDYGYDHVTKGKRAVRSGDVINNVYNTAGPNAGDLSDESLYNTTGGAKNRPDVINNIYSAPSPVTDSGCDVDYYNVTSVPHASRDVGHPQ